MKSHITPLRSKEDFPYLTEEQFNALPRLAAAIGSTAFENLLTLAQDIQVDAVGTYILNEQVSAQAAFEQANLHRKFPNPNAGSSLKLNVSTYSGTESENLLRWFTELEMAMNVRMFTIEEHKVVFAMSSLSGRAKNWAYGCRTQNPDCFISYKDFKIQLEHAFQPPKCEFRMKMTLLDVKQGNRNLHDYIQEIRYLASGIVQNPMTENTLITLFLRGLKPGPVRNQLYRVDSKSFEDAVSLAMQEEFSRSQAMVPAIFSRRPDRDPFFRKPEKDPYAMDCSSIRTSNTPKYSDKSKVKCNYCNKMGHYARDCYARKRNSKGGNLNKGRRPYSNPNQAKNANHQ